MTMALALADRVQEVAKSVELKSLDTLFPALCAKNFGKEPNRRECLTVYNEFCQLVTFGHFGYSSKMRISNEDGRTEAR